MDIYAFPGPYARPHWNANTQSVAWGRKHYGQVWVFHDNELRPLPMGKIPDGVTSVPLDFIRHADFVFVVDRTTGIQRMIKGHIFGPETPDRKSSKLTIWLQERWCKLRARKLSQQDDPWYKPPIDLKVKLEVLGTRRLRDAMLQEPARGPRVIRFALHPGYITSANDSERHWISAGRLADLYGVDMRECIVIDSSRPSTYDGFDTTHLLNLYPRNMHYAKVTEAERQAYPIKERA